MCYENMQIVSMGMWTIGILRLNAVIQQMILPCLNALQVIKVM